MSNPYIISNRKLFSFNIINIESAKTFINRVGENSS